MKPGKEVFTTGSTEETEGLGKRLAKTLGKGSVVALFGELGSGKTTLTKGIAIGLGIKGYVKSPSFTIVNVYAQGRLPLYHIDLYRVSKKAELGELGLEEYVYGEGVSVIEWAERAEGAEGSDLLPEDAVRITLTYAGEDKRRIEVEGGGTESGAFRES